MVFAQLLEYLHPFTHSPAVRGVNFLYTHQYFFTFRSISPHGFRTTDLPRESTHCDFSHGLFTANSDIFWPYSDLIRILEDTLNTQNIPRRLRAEAAIEAEKFFLQAFNNGEHEKIDSVLTALVRAYLTFICLCIASQGNQEIFTTAPSLGS